MICEGRILFFEGLVVLVQAGSLEPEKERALGTGVDGPGEHTFARDADILHQRPLFLAREQRRRDGLWTGLTDNYLRVVTHGEGNLHNRLTATRLLAAQNGCLVGEVSD